MNLVTGASGFIGGRIVRALAGRGEAVRVFSRSDADLSQLADLDYERYTGDISDREAVERAVRGCRRIFHAAALYKLWVGNPTRLYQVNVEGTRHVVEAGLEAGAERIVHTSSVATIGLPDNGLGNEAI
jgi:dihydroflavonol-4-reductase